MFVGPLLCGTPRLEASAEMAPDPPFPIKRWGVRVVGVEFGPGIVERQLF